LILLYAIVAGTVAGLLRAWYHKQQYTLPDLHAAWLVVLAFAPQFFVFYWRSTNELLATELAALVLISTQTLLLIFAWFNRRLAPFWLLGTGLVLNLLVICLNGGLMPISPETLQQVLTKIPIETFEVGKRVAGTKDILLPQEATRLAWLADRFITPRWLPYWGAFSLGDFFITLGAFWLLWRAGGKQPEYTEDMRRLEVKPSL
jgi:hypothetical protein